MRVESQDGKCPVLNHARTRRGGVLVGHLIYQCLDLGLGLQDLEKSASVEEATLSAVFAAAQAKTDPLLRGLYEGSCLLKTLVT